MADMTDVDDLYQQKKQDKCCAQDSADLQASVFVAYSCHNSLLWIFKSLSLKLVEGCCDLLLKVNHYFHVNASGNSISCVFRTLSLPQNTRMPEIGNSRTGGRNMNSGLL